MSYKTNFKNLDVSQEAYESQPGSKRIILIEQTTIVVFVAFVLFKAVAFFLPEDAVLPNTIDLVISLFSSPRTYPVVAGALLSFITWHVMYFDSKVPGINPPTPLSPTKYRVASGADFHLNYLFSLLIGPLVTTMLYAGWV